MVDLTSGVKLTILQEFNLKNMLYKTLFLAQNPDYEYQNRNGSWYRRRKGSKDKWSSPNADGITVLNNAYRGKPKLFFYSKTALIGGVVAEPPVDCILAWDPTRRVMAEQWHSRSVVDIT